MYMHNIQQCGMPDTSDSMSDFFFFFSIEGAGTKHAIQAWAWHGKLVWLHFGTCFGDYVQSLHCQTEYDNKGSCAIYMLRQHVHQQKKKKKKKQQVQTAEYLLLYFTIILNTGGVFLRACFLHYFSWCLNACVCVCGALMQLWASSSSQITGNEYPCRLL